MGEDSRTNKNRRDHVHFDILRKFWCVCYTELNNVSGTTCTVSHVTCYELTVKQLILFQPRMSPPPPLFLDASWQQYSCNYVGVYDLLQILKCRWTAAAHILWCWLVSVLARDGLMWASLQLSVFWNAGSNQVWGVTVALSRGPPSASRLGLMWAGSRVCKL